MADKLKPLARIHGEIASPPMSPEARRRTGWLLYRIQTGEMLSMPESRPMPGIGARCHELRIDDKNTIWRIIYRIDPDVIVILEVFAKKTQETPKHVIAACKKRIKRYDA